VPADVLAELQREVGQRQAAEVLSRQPEVAGATPVADGAGTTVNSMKVTISGFTIQGGWPSDVSAGPA